MGGSLPLPLNPDVGLLQLMVVPHFVNGSRVSVYGNFPIALSAVLVPGKRDRLLWFISSIGERETYSVGI